MKNQLIISLFAACMLWVFEPVAAKMNGAQNGFASRLSTAALEIDLQKEVHEDMTSHFDLYPNLWGLSRTDTNIDHRRVSNLMAFFEGHGTTKEINTRARDYLPGGIVCWNQGGAVRHIGIVADRPSERWNGYKVVHNIGSGQIVEDCLFDFRIIAHYIYTGKNPE